MHKGYDQDRPFHRIARPAYRIALTAIICSQPLNTRSGSTHFAYKLEVPKEPGPAQRTFNVEAEGSLVLAIKVRGKRKDVQPDKRLPFSDQHTAPATCFTHCRTPRTAPLARRPLAPVRTSTSSRLRSECCCCLKGPCTCPCARGCAVAMFVSSLGSVVGSTTSRQLSSTPRSNVMPHLAVP